MPAMYSRLTAAVLVGTALQAIATGEDNSTENSTEDSSDNSTENVSIEDSSDNSTDDNTTDDNATETNVTYSNASVSTNMSTTSNSTVAVVAGNSSTNTSSNATQQIEVHVVKVTMNTSTTVSFPNGTNVSELLATSEMRAKTKTAVENDLQAALDASTSSSAASRRESGDDAESSPWKVVVTEMMAEGATQLDVDASVTKSVDSANGEPTDAAKGTIATQALADTKTFFNGLGSSTLRMAELAAVYKTATGENISTDFSVANTTVSDDVTTAVTTEMRDDPEAGGASAPTSTSTGGSDPTPTSAGGSSTGSGGTVDGTEDTSAASGIALSLAGSVAFLLTALI